MKTFPVYFWTSGCHHSRYRSPERETSFFSVFNVPLSAAVFVSAWSWWFTCFLFSNMWLSLNIKIQLHKILQVSKFAPLVLLWWCHVIATFFHICNNICSVFILQDTSVKGCLWTRRFTQIWSSSPPPPYCTAKTAQISLKIKVPSDGRRTMPVLLRFYSSKKE